jgi:hypothetical protein
MRNVEIRVRPVIRHVVTSYEGDPSSQQGGSRTLGEFDNEGYAEEIADALRKKAAPREFVMVQDTVGEVMAEVFYAYSETEVDAFLASDKAQGKSFKVFSRVRS